MRTAESALCRFHNFDMSRRPIFVALLLSMLMQANTFGSPAAGVGSGQAALHTLLHWAGLAHHHRQQPPAQPSDADPAGAGASGGLRVSAVAGTVSVTCDQDQSPESTQHVLMDGFVSAAAMIPSWPESRPARLPRPAPPSAHAEKVPATPFLEGLRRPPRPTA